MALSKVKRLGKEAFQFRFTSTFEYIALDCSGTWRPTLLKIVWFRNHRRVESLPVQWVVTEDRGPNGAKGKGKFKPAFSVGLVVTLYKGKDASKFDGKEYKYYIQDESETGTKLLASFTIDLKDYPRTDGQDSRDVLEMTFQNKSHKVRDVVLGMTLTSQLLKRGSAIDYDMQSTFSATSDHCSVQLDSEGEITEGEEGGGGEGEREGETVQVNTIHVSEVAPAPQSSEVNSAAFSELKLTKSYSPWELSGAKIGEGPPTVKKQAIPSHTHLGCSFTPKNVNTGRQTSPSPLHSPSPSPSPTRHRSPSPGPSIVLTASTVDRTTEKTKKSKGEKKTLKSFFTTSSRTVKPKTDDQQDNMVVTQSPPPASPSHSPGLSPPPHVNDCMQRPWEDITEMIQKLQKSVQRLEKENKVLHASMEIQGWLFKRGVRGVTAHVWRNRFFRCEGSKIYYYKSVSTPTPQGYIDLDKVLGVREVCPEEQDKNCATFIVRCEGRTFQLQAMDQTTMKKWMSAIQLLTDWRKSYSEKTEEIDRENLVENFTDARFLNSTAVH